MALANFSKTAIRNLFHKPVTTKYPFEKKEYPERTRGRVEIDINECILCGMCMRKCPTGAISVDRDARTWTIERFGCIQCRNCVVSCPKKCLHMETQYPEPSDTKYTYTAEKPAPTPEELAAEAAKKEAIKQAALKAAAAKKAKEAEAAKAAETAPQPAKAAEAENASEQKEKETKNA